MPEELMGQISTLLAPLASAVVSYLVAMFTMRRKALEKKIDRCIHSNVPVDLSQYELFIDGKVINCSLLDIRKKEVIKNEQKSKNAI
nr:MAG: hypothetical protein [Microvirus Sku121]